MYSSKGLVLGARLYFHEMASIFTGFESNHERYPELLRMSGRVEKIKKAICFSPASCWEGGSSFTKVKESAVISVSTAINIRRNFELRHD